jgi:NUMOD4 motif
MGLLGRAAKRLRRSSGESFTFALRLSWQSTKVVARPGRWAGPPATNFALTSRLDFPRDNRYRLGPGMDKVLHAHSLSDRGCWAEPWPSDGAHSHKPAPERLQRSSPHRAQKRHRVRAIKAWRLFKKAMSSLRFNSIGYEPTMERWLPVVGYEGIYEVSNRGRVKSLARMMGNEPGKRVRETSRETSRKNRQED